MHIIKTVSDIKHLELNGSITPELAHHLAVKLNKTREDFAPELPLEDFNLEEYGVFGLLEATDTDFSAIGLPESLDSVMPEFVTYLEMKDDTFYILYFMPDNDLMDQIYIPDSAMSDKIRQWISELPIEEERGENF